MVMEIVVPAERTGLQAGVEVADGGAVGGGGTVAVGWAVGTAVVAVRRTVGVALALAACATASTGTDGAGAHAAKTSAAKINESQKRITPLRHTKKTRRGTKYSSCSFVVKT
jgi:hypothetical protein